jgi:hypothetical protein
MKRFEGTAVTVVIGLMIAAWSGCGGSTGGGSAVCGDAGVCPAGTVCNGTECVNPNVGGTGGFGGTGGTDVFGGAGGTTGGFGGTGALDEQAPGAQPPANPGGPTAAGASITVIAADKLLLGDTDPSGYPNASAWRSLGYNIDGLISTKNGTNHCKPQAGASPSSVKTDGDNGIDNSFGSNLVPIFASLASNPSQTITDAMLNGSFTMLFRLDKLQDPGIAPNQTGIGAAYYAGAKFDVLTDCFSSPSDPHCSPPKWNGTDSWPVLFEALASPNLDDSKVKFPSSYVSGGTWVSGSQATIVLTLAIQGFPLPLPITHAVVGMNIQGADSYAVATNGVIAGVIPTEQLISEFKKVAGGFDQSLCEGATFESIAQELRQASDIMQDGSNGDPNLTCDGISVGLGFEGKGASISGIAPPVPPPTDPCAL